MDIRLNDVVEVRKTRGGITLMIEGCGAYYFTEEQFICFHEAIRHVVVNYDDHIYHHGLGYDVIRPEYLHWGDDRFCLVLPYEENGLEQLEKNLQRIDQLLGFYYRDAEFVYLYSGSSGPNRDDLMVGLHRTGSSGSTGIDVSFAFRREGSKRWLVPGRIRHYIAEDFHDTYIDIEPFEVLPAYFPYLSDLLGGVTETNSLPETGYTFALECGLGQLNLGHPTKNDLKAIQRKLMK